MRFFNKKQPKWLQGSNERSTNDYRDGGIAGKHFNQNFRDSGFRNNGLRPWPETRRQREGKGADRRRKPLISAAPHLLYTTNINNEVPLSSKKVVRM